MSRLRRHLQNKSAETEATPEATTPATDKPAQAGPSARIRRNRPSHSDAEETVHHTPQVEETENTIEAVEPVTDTVSTSITTEDTTESSETMAEPVMEKVAPPDQNAPRLHAAPPQAFKKDVRGNSVEETVEVVLETQDIQTDISTEPEQIPSVADIIDGSIAETLPPKSKMATKDLIKDQTKDQSKAQTKDPKSPTVHAAPPEAYLRAKQAVQKQQGLGSAVVTPPPHFLPDDVSEKDSPSKRTNRMTTWDVDDDDSKGANKASKEKRSVRRGKTKDWSAGDGEQETSPTSFNRQRRKKGKVKESPKAKAIKRRVMLDGSITVSELAHAMSQKAGAIIKYLIGLGEMATLNDKLDFETAQMIAAEFEYEVVDVSFQEEEFLIVEDNQEGGELRPPVVTIMGHVDHGKTTLLDTIRKANVAGGEAGGITQHTSAYQVEHDGQLITFIDTPGHEAFTAMRARGAQVTDIVILVVAADDGPMPQTIEALNHARASGVQLMVAVNKCDKPGANPDKVRQEMMRYELVSEEYGGDTIFVNVSGLKGEGIDDLLENITLLAEMGEYKAPVERHAEGFVLEARLEKGRGPVANLLVKQGTLNVGDTLVLGKVWGRVRAMYDFNGKPIKKATPSMPIELIGLQEIPEAGDDFVVVKKPKDAKALVDHRIEEAKKKATSSANKAVSLEELLRRQVEGEPVKLNLIIKSDVGGTLEAMKGSIGQINVPGTEVNILHAAIGGITESDVSLAHTYEGIIIGFNVRPDAKARQVVNQTNVEVRTYSVIYEALEDLEKGLKGLLEPEIKEQWKGSAEIRETFNVPKVGTVAGCYVLDGTISRKHQIRLLRDGTIVWEGRLASLRRFKDDVRDVEKGYECGMNLDGFNDIKVGDQLETFMMEEEARD